MGNIKRKCTISNKIIDVLEVCPTCRYFGGEDALFTRYSCMHPVLQDQIDESIKNIKKDLYGE